MSETVQYLSVLFITRKRHANVLVTMIRLKLWLRDWWTHCKVAVSLNACRK